MSNSSSQTHCSVDINVFRIIITKIIQQKPLPLLDIYGSQLELRREHAARTSRYRRQCPGADVPLQGGAQLSAVEEPCRALQQPRERWGRPSGGPPCRAWHCTDAAAVPGTVALPGGHGWTAGALGCRGLLDLNSKGCGKRSWRGGHGGTPPSLQHWCPWNSPLSNNFHVLHHFISDQQIWPLPATSNLPM